MANTNSLRIIGGAWRSRRIQFIDSPKIRPTPDRVRETLFNWLAPSINGTRCLDLFAGSGALGFEAMSRGADQVVLVEADPRTAAMLAKQKALFNEEGIEVRNQNALPYLQELSQQFDLIFLDPPFDANL
ncbi:MAG: 16S rRNA (guanine(966)-N(2))-methyltransferase RsmD, partial [Gammaproteobacteria bacterium]